jgi:signal transduction histidine kinase
MVWTRPPHRSRSLILLIVAITVVPLATLLWVGWRLLEQDRLLQAQQTEQRIERAADLVVAALQRAMAASERRLAADGGEWPEGAVAVTFSDGLVQASPRTRLAFLPVVQRPHEPPAAVFTRGDELEFRQRNHAAAAEFFRDLAGSSPAADVRAVALLRLGRNLHAARRTREALDAYAQLTELAGVSIGDAPAAVVGRYARCKLFESQNRLDDLHQEAGLLRHDLSAAASMLTGPIYRLYARDADRWTGTEGQSIRQDEIFAEAAAALWERWNGVPRRSIVSSDRELLQIQDQTVAVLWQASADTFRALLAGPGFIESEWLAPVAAVEQEQNVSIALSGRDGQSTFGRSEPPAAVPSESERAGIMARRSAAQAELPWNVAVQALGPQAEETAFVLRRRLLMAGFLLLVTMALAASYVIVRSVNRELAVARLQSDFVAAVSHEFRTPLTALRQFTDVLKEHGALDDERRRVCYDAQSRATDRLTRLVESLLDFGRMEAGARAYRFEPLDSGALVRTVVEEFQREVEHAGYRVDLRSNGSAPIEADGEALSRALWNLLDNAVKYSPDDRTVEVGLESTGDSVLIAVRDYGIGIPAGERAALFSRFRRGEQARARGIRGTGIGLAMVNQIVTAHRGRVNVESEPGQGSTFTIVLPLAAPGAWSPEPGA